MSHRRHRRGRARHDGRVRLRAAALGPHGAVAPATSVLSLLLVRPAKGLLIALQYQHKAEEGRLAAVSASATPAPAGSRLSRQRVATLVAARDPGRARHLAARAQGAGRTALLAQIEARAYGAPGAIAARGGWPAWRAAADEFRRVRLDGHVPARQGASPLHGLAEERRGAAAPGLLRLHAAAPRRRLDRDRQSRLRADGTARPGGAAATRQPAGRVAVTGLAAHPESAALFVPENDPARGDWFVRDLGDMARARGLDRASRPSTSTPMRRRTRAAGRAAARPGSPAEQPPAIRATWFGLAGDAARRLRGLRGGTPRRPSGDELQADDAGHDQPDAGEPDRGRRVAEQDDAEDRRPDRADAGPDRVAGADRQRLQREAEQARR